jgi:hypothetical protein
MSKHQRIDITGFKFGLLTVIDFSHTDKLRSYWNCSCECGKSFKGNYTELKSEKRNSCGCLVKNYFHDLTGQKYNKILLVRYIGQNKWKCHSYEAQCDCGNIFNVEGSDVKSEKIKSCGCAKNDKQKAKADYFRSALRVVYAGYRNKAKPRGIEFDLEFEDFRRMCQENCYYCGCGPSNIKKNAGQEFKYNGLDRVENMKPYVLSNCVPCCYICNQAKHRMTKEYFLSWVKRIHSHLFGDKGNYD